MTELLTTIAIIFIVAGPFLLLAKLFRLPTAPALIISGLLAGVFIDPELKIEIARLGIALLVFTFAIKIQTTDIQTAIADSEVAALAQISIIGSAGFGIGLLLGLDPEQAIFLGIAAAISSSIMGSTLFLPGSHDVVHDKLSESIHSIQDFTGLFVLLIVSAGVYQFDPIAQQLGYGVILLLAAILVNRYLFELIGRFARRANESVLIAVIAMLLLFLGAAELLGISIVVGAFAAGLAVKHDSVHYSGVFNGMDSINDFFAAIFFITVGSLVTWPDFDVIVMASVLVVLVGVVKPAITIAVLIYMGYERRTATLTGFNLDQIGEFALIIAIEALFLGLLIDSLFEAIILAAALTMVTSSFTRRYDEEIYHLLANTGLLGHHGRSVERWSEVPESLTDHIVIVGYGRHGRRLIEVCEDNDHPYVVIESNPALLEDMKNDCEAYVFGDLIERRTVEKARLTAARMVISTADTRPVNERVLRFAEQVDVIVRTKDRQSAREYLQRGAVYVAVSDLLAADYLEGRLSRLIAGDIDGDELRDELIDASYQMSPIPRHITD